MVEVVLEREEEEECHREEECGLDEEEVVDEGWPTRESKIDTTATALRALMTTQVVLGSMISTEAMLETPGLLVDIIDVSTVNAFFERLPFL